MTEKEYKEKILEKIKEMSDEMNARFDNLTDLKSEIGGLRSDFKEIREVANNRFSVIHEKLDNIIEINNKINFKE